MAMDHSTWLWRKGIPLAECLGVLLLTGWLLQPTQNAVWQEVSARQPELNLKELGDNLGQGTLLGVLGGFRSIVADFIWIKGYTYWEQRDRANTEASVWLAATVDPENLQFWDEGSSMIGLDIPAWTLRQFPPAQSAAEQRAQDAEANKVMREQGLRGIDLLEHGLRFKPHSYTLLEKEAQLYYRLSNFPNAEPTDLPNSATKFREAADATTQPYLAARLYIRLLRMMGRDREAYDYLVNNFYPGLPNNVPDVQKALMWSWIVGLEDVLKIPPDQRPKNIHPPPDYNDKDFKDEFEDLSKPRTF